MVRSFERGYTPMPPAMALQELDDRFRELRKDNNDLKNRLDGVEKRLDGVEKRLDGLQQGVDQIVGILEQRMPP